MDTRQDDAPAGRARLEDVARRAAVSKATASKILNSDPTFSARQETRDRVFAAANKLGYRAHVGARALATSRARTLALLVPQLTNPTYVTIARGAYERASERGYVSVLAEDFGGQAAMAAFNELVDAGRVDGLVIASALPEDQLIETVRASATPHIFLNRSVAGSGRNVVMDVAQSSRTALQHLALLGHRVVAHVAGPRGIRPSDERAEAFIALAPQFGLDVATVEHVEFSESGGALGAARSLTHSGITAIYASSLAQAIGVLYGVHDAGLSVPADISVVGNDDFPIANYLRPRLTTVAMPLWELGRAGVDALIDQLEGGQPHDMVITTNAELIVRDSTAPPRGWR